ncbi:MAG: hypothetical protein HQK88_06695 [Nitrospirae bacterium]|nr:hypothetical protein [Nitrospirota bacterium]MBF0534815.1 hypothetical protein [Nitrospirota bacterium]MBF0616489.1 hypothetical protein [Nitrospirota bacterium]
MSMRKAAYVSVFVLMSLVMFSGCASVQPTPTLGAEGINVEVWELASDSQGALACQKDGESTLAMLTVNEKSITDETGKIPKSKLSIILSYIRSVLGETRRSAAIATEKEVKPGTKHHMLKVKIHDFSQLGNDSSDSMRVKRTVRFKATFNIVRADGYDCSSGEPITKEATDQQPAYNASRLKPFDFLEDKAIKEAVKEALQKFVPVKKMRFRPVETGDGAVRQSASMLDNGNCEGAMQLLTKHLAANPNDAKANYNMGVAIECSSKGVRAVEYRSIIIRASKYYANAVRLDPANTSFNHAQKDLDTIKKQLGYIEIDINNDVR